MDENKKIRAMLDNEYEETLMSLNAVNAEYEEARWRLQKLSELHKQRMSEQEAELKAELQKKELSLKEREASLKEEQQKESKKDRIIRYILDGLAILLPVSVSSYWMAKGLRFEQTGSFTSRTGQWLSNHLKLFRK